MCFLGDPGKGLLTEGVTRDVMLRRNFLVKTLSRGPAAEQFFKQKDMQFAGEWMLVTYSMAACALTNIAMQEPKTAHESSVLIAQWIEACLDKKIAAFDSMAWAGDEPLDEDVLDKDRGHLGYYGHLNLMLGCYALLNNDGRFSQLHKTLSDAIARRMRKYPHRHVETYPSQTYPADNTVAAASLRVSDMTQATGYKSLVDEWVEQSKKIEWQPYGLIVFQIDSVTGQALQTCRGSHMGWNSFFMPLVDEEYARVQFGRFKKHMLQEFPGIAAFKEYPEGRWFTMDCDTGPVIFGLGGTATGFSAAGARWAKDAKLLSCLLRPVELLGVSATKENMRRYVALPVVADAIMLAMKTAVRWKPLWE